MKKLVLALAAVVLIATPALADYSIYGSARIDTTYLYTDDATPAENRHGFNVDLRNNSRFGAKMTTGDVSGRVEIGFSNAKNWTATYMRLIYGEVKLGEGTLLVGQTYTPYWSPSSMVSSVDQGSEGFGAAYDGRHVQIKYTMDNGFYVAAIKNVGAGEVLIPKLNAGYKGAAGEFKYNTGVAYQTSEVGVGIAAPNYDLDSYLLYFNGKAKLGEIGMTYGLHYGMNLTEFGITGRAGLNATAANDVTCFGVMLEGSMMGANLGFGYTSDDLDGAAEADTQMTVYANYPVKVVKGFTITPEVSYWDFMEDSAGVDQGDQLYVGAKWQMDF